MMPCRVHRARRLRRRSRYRRTARRALSPRQENGERNSSDCETKAEQCARPCGRSRGIRRASTHSAIRGLPAGVPRSRKSIGSSENGFGINTSRESSNERTFGIKMLRLIGQPPISALITSSKRAVCYFST